MATPKLQTSREQRAVEIPVENILPALPDGRNVIIGRRDIYLTSLTQCSCGDNRFKKNVCKHMLRLVDTQH